MSASPEQAMNTILKTLVAPELHDPIRLPSYPVIERTSTLGFNTPAEIELPGSETRMLITRQSVFPVWADQAVTGFVNGAMWRGASMPAIGVGPSVINVDFVENLDLTWTGTRAAGIAGSPGPAVTGANVTGVLPYSSNAPLIGVYGRRRFVYIPANYLGCVMAGAYAGNNLVALNASVTLYECAGEENYRSTFTFPIPANKTAGQMVIPASNVDRWFSVAELTLQGAASITVNESFFVTIMAIGGTYTYTDSGTGGNHGEIAVTASTVTGLLPAAFAPDFAVTQLPWMACRTTAVGVAITNISPVLTKSGSILAGRVDPTRYWPWNCPKSVVANLHKSDKCLSSLQNGFYTYVPPSTDIAEFSNYIEFNDRYTAGELPVYRLDNTSMTHLLFLSNLSSDSQSVTASVSWHLEFRNTSTLFPIGISRFTIEVMHQAQMKMMTMGFFHPNSNIPAVLRGSFKGGIDERRANVRIQPSKLMTETNRQPSRPVQVKRRPARQRGRKQAKANSKSSTRQNNSSGQKKKGGLQMYLDSRK